MLALTTSALSLVATSLTPGALQRTTNVQMYDLGAYDGIWSHEAKMEVYNKWDPEQPRSYQNFNPFERNDEGQPCDPNGCFSGQSKGYKPPNRPDVSWARQQELNGLMDELKKDPKFSLTGKPGCFSSKWQEGLGAPTDSW